MINISQRVNYFFARRDPLLRRSLPFGRVHWLPDFGALILPPCFPFRAAFPAARKRRDSKQRNPITQVIFKKIAKKTGAVTAPVSSSLAYPFAPACRRQKPQ
ncbi:hypothetical protein [Burkholderia glumae]|nr:hypothetical protein [Burkholderia glumae]QHE10357.1 hypothetical protein GQR88_08030 [Burkholderia glumae AU6208]